MSVTLRRFRRGGWEVDIRLVWPDGRKMRVRKKAPVSSHGSALRWGQAREQELFSCGLEKPRREAPTLAEFAPRFVEGYARANRQKPSGVAAKEMILRVHLLPAMGSKKLDAIGNEDVQRLKRLLESKAPKTANNVLTVLGRLLRVAVEWEVIEKMPCSIRLLPVPPRQAAFHDFEAFERLVTAARRASIRRGTSWCSSVGKRACAAARCALSSGGTWISRSGSSGSSGRTGSATWGRPRVGGSATCR